MSILTVFFLVSCDGDYHIEAPDSRIVVEGWIENDGFPIVILTKTLPVKEDGVYIDDLQDYLIRWAKVTVSDGKDTVILTGMCDERYFPPFIYTTGHLRGQCGRTYYLKVEYKDFYATAETTIPLPPLSTGYTVEPCSLSDTLFQITASFQGYRDNKDYYQLFAKVGERAEQYLACLFGSIDDSQLKEEGDLQVPVLRGHFLLEEEYTPYFKYEDTVGVKLAHLDYDSFDFWYNYSKSQPFSSNMFLSSSINLPSNIRGGYGYWCGYGAVNTEVVIKDLIEHHPQTK